MNKKLSVRLAEILSGKNRKKRWHRVVSALMALVVFITTYALILPAITLEITPECGIEEHCHGPDCYDEEGNLICGLLEHEHTEACSSHNQKDSSDELLDDSPNDASPVEGEETKLADEETVEEAEIEQSDITEAEEFDKTEEAEKVKDTEKTEESEEKLYSRTDLVKLKDNLKAPSFVPNGIRTREETINIINSGLNLGALAIGGTQFNDYFYYGNVAADSRVSFDDAESYADYLVDIYEQAEAESGANAALDVVREEWDRYLYDIYTPANDMGELSNQHGYPLTDGYGDGGLGWPKDNSSSFHSNVAPVVKSLSHGFMENGIDYSNFVTGLNKSATAAAPGDGNVERKYSIDITADVQAKARAPVAMIFQIQTSWQMFDLLHANALPHEGYTDNGRAAETTQMANLYDIKRALLRFVDYMANTYAGNNLVLGITEIEHGGTNTMFYGTDDKNNPLYVTNDYDALHEGIIGWDTFGNCEHVHYKDDVLKNAVSALSGNLSDWYDFNYQRININDVQKVAVIVGGPTENKNSEDGYGASVKWGNLEGCVDSVYGIRNNIGYVEGGPLSWLDNDKCNGDTPFNNGFGNAFTKKYVAPTEDEMFNTFVRIANDEMNKKSMEILESSAYVDDITVKDVVADEFAIDPDAQITATIYNKDGSVYETRNLGLSDLTINENPDGTTEVSYNFGRVYNTKKCVLHFGVVAKDDYIGSNNVFTNVGTPELSYIHYEIDGDGELTGDSDEYHVMCGDTPEVNVPIRYSTVDGDRVTISMDDIQQLADLSSAIVEDVEDRIDNYDQINGTLSYEWVLPGGTRYPAGSVNVVNGSIGSSSFPDRDYIYVPQGTDIIEAVLEVTFAPNAVMDNGNYSDGDTMVGVIPRVESGKVWVDSYDPNVPRTLYVQKQWNTSRAEDISPIMFEVLANGQPANDVNGNPVTGVLSADNNWEMLVENLPPVDSSNNVIEYSVRETAVPQGYAVEYGRNVYTKPEYSGRVTLQFTAKADIRGNTLVINYSYGGSSKTYTITSPNLKKNVTYTYVIDGLPLDAQNEPYSASFNGMILNGRPNTNYLNESAETEAYESGSKNADVFVITNTLETVNLEVTKQVVDSETTQKFDFEAEISQGAFLQPSGENGYTLDSDGKAHFSLADGESVTLTMLKGSVVSLQETSHNGYSVSIKQGTETVSDNDAYTATMSGDTALTVTNTFNVIPEPRESVTINKTIDYLGDGEANPDTTATGEDLYRLYLNLTSRHEPVDLLLVIDQSGSMEYTIDGRRAHVGEPSRQDLLTDFLNGENDNGEGFIHNFLEADSRNDLAILTFSGDCSMLPKRYIRQWGDTSDVTVFNAPGGATNYTAALDNIDDVFALRLHSDNRKIVVFLSDGEPTVGYLDGKLHSSYADEDNLFYLGSTPKIYPQIDGFFNMMYYEVEYGDPMEDGRAWALMKDTYGATDDYGRQGFGYQYTTLDGYPYCYCLPEISLDVQDVGITEYPWGDFTEPDKSTFSAFYAAWQNKTNEEKLAWFREHLIDMPIHDMFALTKSSFDEFKSQNPDVTVYSIGYGSDFSTTTNSGVSVDDVLDYFGGHDRYYLCMDVEDLAEIFTKITGIENIRITDTLSNYAQLADDPELKITMKEDTESYVLYENGALTEKGIEVLDTTTPILTQNGNLTVQFKPELKYLCDVEVEASFNIRPTGRAYREFANNGYNAEGDGNTDYLTNDTSSENAGFYSNGTAVASWTSDEEKSKEFPKPVIQVHDTVTLTVTKEVTGYTTDEEFPFEATIHNGVFLPPLATDKYTLDTDGNAHFNLADGESVTLTMLKGSVVSLQETSHNGYSVSIKQGTETVSNTDMYQATISANTALDVTNTRILWSIVVNKTDKNDTSVKLSGAIFGLYSPNAADQLADCGTYPATVEKDGVTYYLCAVETTNAQGKIIWSDLAESDYVVKELQAPEGYYLPDELISAETDYSQDSINVYVTNETGYELPETGGSGTNVYTLLGLLLMAIALMCGYVLRRIHERRTF